MNKSNEQNGRQPPGSQQTAPPTDPRTRNITPASEQQKVCRDYIWGICTKGQQCIFRHERDFDSMKSILKFCHDFQNKTGCTRPDCTYLHTTREEENLFLNTGQIPRVLAERYASMSVPIPAESMSHNMLFMAEFMGQTLAQPPPPPPPPAALPVGAALQPPLPRAPLPPSLLAPPPPPPPPTEATTTVRTAAPKYTTASPQRPMMTPLTQPPPPLPPVFDRTKPPPPLPPQPNGAQKRAAEPTEAGPSKARKADSSKVIDICDSCVQRELRIELYRQEMQKLQCELEYKSMIFDKKMEEYENGRLLLRSIVSPELYHILDEYVEGSSSSVPAQDILSQFNNSPFGLGNSSKSSLAQLVECILENGNSRNIFDTSTSEDTILQSLTALSRTRTSTVDNTSTELLQTVLKLIRTTSTSASTERSPAPEARSNDMLGIEPRPSTSAVTNNSSLNGMHPFVNGQKVDRSPTEVAGPRFPPVPSVPPSVYGCSAGTNATNSYLPYQTAVPPPVARPFFTPNYQTGATNMPNNTPAFNPAARMSVPQSTPRPNLPAAAPNAPNMSQTFNQYLMGRYPPQPPFYPPYQ